MYHWKSHPNSRLPQLIICLCLLFLTPLLCIAQQKPLNAAALDEQVIKIDVKGASLDTMITLLGKKLHAGIVVDDRPHHAPIDFTMETTPRKALDRIADAFDYSWKLTRNGMVMLYKRFKDPTEFPQTDLAEWQQMAKDAISAMDADAHEFTTQAQESTVRALLGGLSNANIRLLRSGKPVKVSDLDERQFAPLREYLYQRAFDEVAGGWIVLRKWLSEMADSGLQMRMDDDRLDLVASQQEHRKPQQVLTLMEICVGNNGRESIFALVVPQTEVGNGIRMSGR